MRKLLKVLTVFLLLSTVVCYAAPKAAAAKKAPAKKEKEPVEV